MSCDWDVYCVDCKEESGIPDANHREELMDRLIAQREGLEKLGELVKEFDVELKIDYQYVNPQWFTLHRGHKLRARNEYGEFGTPCGHRFLCRYGCGEVTCDRGEGHSGSFNRMAKLAHADHWHSKKGDHLVHREKEPA